ncbi:MAG: hypothetical protein IRY99_19505 [Isosphaeraceae bacterium]|nr:hypothetical protein [Isosphaeraceae bacterium]
MNNDRERARRARDRNRSRSARLGLEPLEARELLTIVLGSNSVQIVSDQVGSITISVDRVLPPGATKFEGKESATVATVGGTAVPGVDYEPVRETITFEGQERHKMVTIPILPDFQNTTGRSILVAIDDAPYPSNMPDPSGPAVVPAFVRGTGDFNPTVHQNDPKNAIIHVVHRTDLTPPTVKEAHLITRGNKVTGFVLTFSKDMAPGPVEDVRNYVVREDISTWQPRWARGLPRPDFTGQNPPPATPVPLKSAEYNPKTRSVTLTPVTPVKVSPYYWVENPQILQPNGTVQPSPLTDTAGNYLDDGLGGPDPEGRLIARFSVAPGPGPKPVPNRIGPPATVPLPKLKGPASNRS